MNELDILEDVITALDFEDTPGLQRANGQTRWDNRGFVWREMQRKCGVYSAYFHGGVPLVAFGAAGSPGAVGQIRQRLWNLNRVPILIGATPEEILAFSCFDAPAPNGVASTSALLARPANESSDLVEQFSRLEVERGGVASRYRDRFKQTDRVDHSLLSNLQALRKKFDADPDELRLLDTVIGRVIFIRYLEDRKILPISRLQEATGKRTLIEVLRSGAAVTYELFALLADKFNGDIFDFPESERNGIKDANLAAIGHFLAGDDLSTGQQGLWPYDFSIIPTDLISSVYERLLEESQHRDGAYYTPRRVVDLILDETFPLNGKLPQKPVPANPRILDPACGSGMFLTETFRRLIFQRFTVTGESSDFNSLAHLLTQSIFGVDKSLVAVNVAAMGLYLALLEEVDSESIWESARLPRIVGENLIVSDFFAEHRLSGETFDVVVGNPPWGTDLSEAAEEYAGAKAISVPDRQVALVFLHAAAERVAPSGVLGFLLPSKSLLHNRSKKAVAFRRTVFESFGVETVIDLATMRRDLFQSAKAPAAVLIARPASDTSEPDDAQVLHVAVRPSPLQSSIDGFVVSSADLHTISARLARQSNELWKTLLWGSMADHELITRLRHTFETLGDLASKRKWVYGHGVQVVGGDENDARDLVGMPYVGFSAIQPFHVDMKRATEVTKEIMHRPRSRELFERPHVLIRRGLWRGRPAAAFSDQDLVHSDSIIGISAPEHDEDRLRLLTAYINSSIGTYYHFLTSGTWGVDRKYLSQNAHLSFPVPEPPPNVASAILATLECATADSEDWHSSLDDVVFEAYQLTAMERQRVVDSLSMNLDRIDKGVKSRAFDLPKKKQISTYVKVLQHTLQRTLPSTQVSTDVHVSNACYAVVIVGFGHNMHYPGHDEPRRWPDSNNRLHLLETLVARIEDEASEWPSQTTIVQPSEMVLQDRVAYLVKRREARYWTATQAHEDTTILLGAIVSAPDRDPTNL